MLRDTWGTLRGHRMAHRGGHTGETRVGPASMQDTLSGGAPSRLPAPLVGAQLCILCCLRRGPDVDPGVHGVSPEVFWVTLGAPRGVHYPRVLEEVHDALRDLPWGQGVMHSLPGELPRDTQTHTTACDGGAQHSSGHTMRCCDMRHHPYGVTHARTITIHIITWSCLKIGFSELQALSSSSMRHTLSSSSCRSPILVGSAS